MFGHARDRDLVRLFEVKGPSRGTLLRLELPTSVAARWHLTAFLDLGREGEKACGCVERCVDGSLANPVADDLEEPGFGSCVPQSVIDIGLRSVRVGQVNNLHVACDIDAITTEGSFLGEFSFD